MFFEGTPAVARELNRVMRISDDIIRHAIYRVEPKHVDTTRIEKPSEPPLEELTPEDMEAEQAEAFEEETAVEQIDELQEDSEAASEEETTESAEVTEPISEEVVEAAKETIEKES